MWSSAAETPFSALINHPKATVARLASARELRLRRRDSDDLVLTKATRAEQEVEVVSAATRIFAAMVHRDGAALSLLVNVVPEAFPWVRFLPAEDVRAFVVELVRTLRAADSVGNPAPGGRRDRRVAAHC
ncbi:hypothetical protein OU415_24165 [Saccharopolyspora sp. WRP15-2]|uniref:Uncharacterized protein n=1 Tax=Saccharopolyspora oryzae TaxID=2997343 RepID=A0ABT4V3L1_9PSEU|nr:hypothetical protein [Saccharopolyspora oryzae]MDA3628549.1 hypothetical protein [Saccharopolyspora oryzae]